MGKRKILTWNGNKVDLDVMMGISSRPKVHYGSHHSACKERIDQRTNHPSGWWVIVKQGE